MAWSTRKKDFLLTFLLIELLIASVQIVVIRSESHSNSNNNNNNNNNQQNQGGGGGGGPTQCPTDITMLTTMMTNVHQRHRRLGTPSPLVPPPTSNTIEVDDGRLNFALHHPIVSPKESILLQGLRYTVQIELLDPNDSFEGFLLQSTQMGIPYGVFVPHGVGHNVSSHSTATTTTSTNVRFCRQPKSIIWSATYSKMTSLSITWMSEDEPIMDCINMTVYLLLESNRWHHKTVLLCNKEANCHYYVKANYYGILQEKDLKTSIANNCSENIIVLQFSPQNKAFLQFQAVNLLFSKISSCSKEYIDVSTVEDGHWVSNKFCGYLDHRKLARLHFTSEDEAIILRLKLVEGSTFKAVHYVLDRRKGCNNTVASSRGVVTSPNFPGRYFPGLDCYVHIRVQEGERAVLRLRQLRLQKTANGSCGPDFVELRGTKSVSHRRFCGDIMQYAQQYTTLFISSDVTVHFHSDWLDESAGFMLDYAVSVSCGQELHRNSNGTIFNFRSLENIEGTITEQWEDCFTTIHVPYGYNIQVTAMSQGIGSTRFVPSLNGGDAMLNSETANCSDGFVELVERDTSWILCDITSLTNASHITQTNTLLVRLVRDRLKYLPPMTITYQTLPVNQSQLDCDYGWVAGVDHCYLLVEQSMTWETAEDFCQQQDGHLASVPNAQTQLLLDAIVNNSLLQDEYIVLWIGGNDRMYENCYQWADGKPMSFTNWFKGWPQYNYYNWQPSDDGLSSQDCVEMRRTFMYPTKGLGSTDNFFWNDRDCLVANPFICEKLKDGVIPKPYPASCNRTIILSLIRPEDVVTSPAYPDPYPSDMECTITVTAPLGYKIVIAFANFVLEDAPSCQYDYMEIVGTSLEPRRYCGDWKSRLKLLRHESVENQIVIKFVSDFSHSFAGFIANVHIEKENNICDDGWQLGYDDQCYLFGTTTVSWKTAQQICFEKQANLVSVGSQKEEDFLEDEISKRGLYSSETAYWLGGYKATGSNSWSWNDTTTFIYFGTWYTERLLLSDGIDSGPGLLKHSDDDELNRASVCLSIEWRQSIQELQSRMNNNNNNNNNNGFYWFGQNCSILRRYICKKQASVSSRISNETKGGSSGNITSPNYPSPYNNNLHQTVTIIGGNQTKIIIHFHYLDLEFQDECLYDYVGLQSSLFGSMIRLCGPDRNRDPKWEFVSDNNVAYLTFHTDFADVGGGFFATYKIVDVSSCPHSKLPAETGVITSVNFPDNYLNNMNCVNELEVSEKEWIWIEFDTFSVGTRRGGDLYGDICLDDFVDLTVFTGGGGESELPSSLRLCGNLSNEIQDLGFIVDANSVKLSFHSDSRERFQGFRANYMALSTPVIQRVVHLIPNTTGSIHGLNFPLRAPPTANYTRKLIVPLGYVMQLELKGAVWVDTNDSTCNKWFMEIYDPYHSQGVASTIVFCRAHNDSMAAKTTITSYLNVLYVTEITDSFTAVTGYFKLSHFVKRDLETNNKTAIGYLNVESCDPNPCHNNGQCMTTTDRSYCECSPHYTGMFCHLTLCDLNPCVHGTCDLSDNGYICFCDKGYMGSNCEIKINPCASNPCANRGLCLAENDGFSCKCQIWWQGPQCEARAFKFAYKPLSQRMLEEPFWLGLITVFVVLAVLGCVWCIKRKFADKLEKFFTEEIERSKSQAACKANKRLSLRDQGSPVSLSPQSCPKSLLSRIGLRKHSMFSMDSSGSPNCHENRSFSFDDIMKKSDSHKKLDKRSPGPSQFDKKMLLQSLVAPPTSPKGRRMSLDEFIQMSEKRILERNNSREINIESDSLHEETSFDLSNEVTGANAAAVATATAHKIQRKRVNFRRTLEKINSVSFDNEADDELNLDKMLAISQINNSYLRPDICDFSDGDGSSCSSRVSVDHHMYMEDSANEMETPTGYTDYHCLQLIPDVSDCSSAEVDSSWTSTEILNNVLAEVQVEVHEIPKDPQKQAMEEAAAAAAAAASNRTEDKCGDPTKDDNCTRIQMDCETPPTIAITSPKSPKIAMNFPIEGGDVACTSSKHSNCNSQGNCRTTSTSPEKHQMKVYDCPLKQAADMLSVPTFRPVNKPSSNSVTMQDMTESLQSGTQLSRVLAKQAVALNVLKVHNSPTNHKENKTYNTSLPVPFNQPLSPGFNTKPPPLKSPVRPRMEITTYNVHDHSRLSKIRPPPLQIIHSPSKPYKKHLQDMDKTGSLDLPAPIITITSNISSCESDTDSPTKTTTRMHYLSPFDIIRQSTERSTSLSNLSSSGYSSMASPGPSRCSSNSPLFGADNDDSSPGSRPSPTNMNRKYGQHLSPSNLPLPVSPKHCQKGLTVPKTGQLGTNTAQVQRVRPPLLRSVSIMRKRSDSETTDDQPEPASLPEDSNDDEGIGMDHIDFKIHRGEVTSAKDLEMYMDREKAEADEDDVDVETKTNGEVLTGTAGVAEFVCPSIVIQTMLHNETERDRCWKFVRRKSFQRKLSPVSSRSESPMSDLGGQNPNEKFSSLFFGNEKGSLYVDSDDMYDGPSSEVVNSPTDNKSPPPAAFQPRKQTRRREKSHGNKAKNLNKLRTKMNGETSKEDRSYKRSPKQRLRVQNSLDADSSSSESSSTVSSPKDPLLLKELKSNGLRSDCMTLYRKRMLSRAESLPVAMHQQNISTSGRYPSSSRHYKSMQAQQRPLAELHSYSAPAAETNDTLAEECLPEYCNGVGGIQRSASPLFNFSTDYKQNTAYVKNIERINNEVASSEEIADETNSPSDVERWENDPPQDEVNSVQSDDSGSEVSFYLSNSKASACREERKSLLSPARISPDMEVICYSAGGFGRACSEDNDTGLV